MMDRFTALTLIQRNGLPAISGTRAYTWNHDKPSTTKRYINGVCQGTVHPPRYITFKCTTYPYQHTLTLTYSHTPIESRLLFNSLTPQTATAHLQKILTHTGNVVPNKQTIGLHNENKVYTLITPWSQQYTLQTTVMLSGEPIPNTNTTTTFEVTNDRGMAFNK